MAFSDTKWYWLASKMPLFQQPARSSAGGRLLSQALPASEEASEGLQGLTEYSSRLLCQLASKGKLCVFYCRLATPSPSRVPEKMYRNSRFLSTITKNSETGSGSPSIVTVMEPVPSGFTE